MIERQNNHNFTHSLYDAAESQEYGLEHVDLTDFEPDGELLARFPSQNLFRESVLPLRVVDNCIRVAVSDSLGMSFEKAFSVSI